MAAGPPPPWRAFLHAGMSGIGFGAAGILLKLVSLSMEGPEAMPDGKAQAVLALFLLTLLAGEAMASYALLLSRGVVPAAPPGLAEKLFWIPLAPFLLGVAVELPIAGADSSTLLLVELVGNGRAVGPPEAEAAGPIPEVDLGAGAPGPHGGGGDALEVHDGTSMKRKHLLVD